MRALKRRGFTIEVVGTLSGTKRYHAWDKFHVRVWPRRRRGHGNGSGRTIADALARALAALKELGHG